MKPPLSNIKGHHCLGGKLPLWTHTTSARAERGTKNGRFYRTLPTQLRRDGFTYRQIAREGDAAIYEQTWNECSEPHVCFEVIRIRRREAVEVAGKFIEAAEVYPKSEAWGVDGFTYTDKNEAFRKLRQLAKNHHSDGVS